MTESDSRETEQNNSETITKNVVPLYILALNEPLHNSEHLDILHPIPKHLEEEYGINDDTIVRIEPELNGMELNMRLTFGPDVTGAWTNETHLQRGERDADYDIRYPRKLSNATHLYQEARRQAKKAKQDNEDEGPTATFHPISETDMRVSFQPPIRPFRSDAEGDVDLDEHYTVLRPNFRPEQLLGDVELPPMEERTPEEHVQHVSSYEMNLPFEYIEKYELEAGDEVAFHIGPFQLERDDGGFEGKLAIYIDLDPGAETPKRLRGTITREDKAPSGYATKSRLKVYVPKALVHGLGMGRSTLSPDVVLSAEPGFLVVTPN